MAVRAFGEHLRTPSGSYNANVVLVVVGDVRESLLRCCGGARALHDDICNVLDMALVAEQVSRKNASAPEPVR